MDADAVVFAGPRPVTGGFRVDPVPASTDDLFSTRSGANVRFGS
jgi:hypothetical protein